MLTQDNPDIDHVRSVLAYAMKHYNVDPTRIYALGTALGGDFVNMVMKRKQQT
jgi:poly(3-hydroxybutyrate) depolymerase